MDTFSENFRKLLPPHSRILDLGAGQGKQAKAVADEGYTVVAVERDAAVFSHPNVAWYTSDIREWISRSDKTESFDAVFIRNVIQFFEPEYVMRVMIPWVIAHTRPDGIVAIETFFKDPDPAFPRPLKSCWDIEKIKSLFSGWKTILALLFDEPSKDLKGTPRHFYVTQLIVRASLANIFGLPVNAQARDEERLSRKGRPR